MRSGSISKVAVQELRKSTPTNKVTTEAGASATMFKLSKVGHQGYVDAFRSLVRMVKRPSTAKISTLRLREVVETG